MFNVSKSDLAFTFTASRSVTALRNPIQRSVRVVPFAKTEKLNGE